MITRLSYEIVLPANLNVNYSWGYWLYSALMERIRPEIADFFHNQELTPMSQYIVTEGNGQSARWVVCVLGSDAEELLLPELEKLDNIQLRGCNRPFALKLISREYMADLNTFLERASQLPDETSHQLRILTPASFKSAGKYMIYPQIGLVLNNLAMRWNAIAPQYLISDSDAMRMMEERIWIRDYKLQTCRFELKDIRIPGFCGLIWLQNRLPAPLMEIWKCLLLFSDYAGIGIKTALGMGATVFRSRPIREKARVN